MRTLAILIPLLLSFSAVGHSFYPPECCSGQDCYEIESSEVRLTKEGAYIVIATNEIFAHPDSKTEIRKAHFSPDGKYHRCTPNGERGAVYTICLFVPRAAES